MLRRSKKITRSRVPVRWCIIATNRLVTRFGRLRVYAFYDMSENEYKNGFETAPSRMDALIVCAFARSRPKSRLASPIPSDAKVYTVVSRGDADYSDDDGTSASTDGKQKRSDLDRTWMTAEFEELARGAGFTAVDTIVLTHGRINPATYLGKGQLEQIKAAIDELKPEFVLVNLNLSPVHQRNWREHLGIMVLSRPDVIFDIFERNAHSADGKLQVELARRRYDLPRIMQIFEAQSGARGGIGMRGAGEKLHLKTKAEIRERIHKLEKRLDKVERDRRLRRAQRSRSPIPTVALVGYTNAGKSSLLNALTGAHALVDDRYFATLDPTVRRLTLPGGTQILVGDTVGFIDDLPKELLAAFKATLEELELADLIVHVVDLSRPDVADTVRSVLAILDSLRLSNIPRVTLLNKADAVADPYAAHTLLESLRPAVLVSARTKLGIVDAMRLIELELV